MAYTNISKPSTSYSDVLDVKFWNFLLNEDGTLLLYEDEGKMIIEESKSIYTTITKPS